MDEKGFTLTELLVIVVIVGILAAIAVPNYTNTKEKALDREAISALKLIQNGNKQYYAQYGFYYPQNADVASLPAINGNLSLDLNSANWNFDIDESGGADYTAHAVRSGGARTWSVTKNTEPACTAGTETCLN